MSITDLTRIDKTIEIKAPPERVWQALTTAAELATWFQMTVEGDIALGKEVWMTAAPKHGGMRFSVKIIEMTAPVRFAWQWHPGAADPNVDYSREPRTTVTFTLAPAGKGTRLSVAETGFDAISLPRRAKVLGDNTQGWTEVLVWIQQYVEAAG